MVALRAVCVCGPRPWPQLSAWAQPWVLSLFARQLPIEEVAALWDDLLTTIPPKARDFLTGSPNALPPMLVSCVLANRDALEQSDTVEAAKAALGPLAAVGRAGDGVVQQTRLLRDPHLMSSPAEQERQAAADGSKIRTVTFKNGPLGIILGQDQEGHCVRKFQSDAAGRPMAAQESGQVNVGDVLHAINGVLVSKNLTTQELAGVLQRVGRPLVVAFRRVDRNRAQFLSTQLSIDDGSGDSAGAGNGESPGAGFYVTRAASTNGGPLDPVVITHTEDGFALPHIPGETYDARLRISMLGFHRPRMCDGGTLMHEWVKGELLVSNYRLYFRAQHKQPWPDWMIPVHSVARAETQKHQEPQKNRTVRSITFSCKDGQLRRFSSSRALEEDRAASDEFHRFLRKFYQWAYSAETEFAKACHQAWSAAPRPPVPAAHRLVYSLEVRGASTWWPFFFFTRGRRRAGRLHCGRRKIPMPTSPRDGSLGVVG